MHRVALLVAAAALLAGCGSSAKKAEVQPPAKKTFSGGELTPPKQAPPLALRDADGRAVSLAAQRGKLVLVTFLYTHCPDVCPLIASNLNAAVRALGAKRSDVRVLAVSVDPKGDTPGAVDHVAYTALVDPAGEERVLYGSDVHARDVVHDLRTLMRRAGSTSTRA